MSKREDILFPIGRFVMGSMYEPQTEDADGKPLVIKTGDKKGESTVRYFFGVAIPKGAETHWAYTEWGAKLWAIGHAGHAQAGQLPAFAWKVKDGDSQVPNKKGNKPCDQPGHKGHWVLSFSSAYPPKIVNSDGSASILEKDAVKPGYYIQVYGSVQYNDSTQNPGIYLNHSLVSFQAYGEEIHFGVDPKKVGFGGALPQGAAAAPVGGMTTPPAGLPPPPAAAPVPPAAPAAPVAPPAAPVVPAAPTAVQPSAGFVPAAGAVPPPPAAAPAPPAAGPVMTAAAGATTYAQYIAAGWTDAQLRANGLMV